MSFNQTMQFLNPGAASVGGTNDPAYLGSQYEQQRNAYIQKLMGQQQRAAQEQYAMGGHGGQPQQGMPGQPQPAPGRSSPSPRRNRMGR